MSKKREPTFGEVVRRAREGAQKSQPDIAGALGGGEKGLAVSFFSDVERDRRALNRKHWPKLVRALPTLTIEALAAAHVRTWPVEVDATILSETARAKLAAVLVEVVREEDFP